MLSWKSMWTLGSILFLGANNDQPRGALGFYLLLENNIDGVDQSSPRTLDGSKVRRVQVDPNPIIIEGMLLIDPMPRTWQQEQETSCSVSLHRHSCITFPPRDSIVLLVFPHNNTLTKTFGPPVAKYSPTWCMSRVSLMKYEAVLSIVFNASSNLTQLLRGGTLQQNTWLFNEENNCFPVYIFYSHSLSVFSMQHMFAHGR